MRLDGEVVDGPGVWTGKDIQDFVAAAGERWVSDGGVNLGKWIFGTREDRHFYTVGRSAGEAFFRAYYLRPACAMQMDASAVGAGEGIVEVALVGTLPVPGAACVVTTCTPRI